MNAKREVGEWDNTYGDLGASDGPRLMYLPLNILDPYKDLDGREQPFRPYPNDELRKLADNIKANGIIEPIHVRPRNGRFQILAGHNRCAAAKLAGLSVVPAVEEDVDDIQARKLLIDSNLRHRERLLPSERAKAYRMRMDDMQSRQGHRSDLASSQDAQTGRTDDEVAMDLGISADSLRRYIRLLYLNTSFLRMVDEGSIGVTVGVDLSYLTPDMQDTLLGIMYAYKISKITGKQARELRFAEDLTNDDILAIFNLQEKPQKAPTLQLKLDISDYPPRISKRLKEDGDFIEHMQNAMAQYVRTLQSDTGL